jgi:hypothetical protein
MDMRFTLDSVLGVDDAFPFGVALPVGSFLDLLIGPKAPSGLALIETLFRSLVRHHPRRQVGLVEDFEVNVAARLKSKAVAEAEVVEASPDGGGSSVGGSSTRQQKKRAEDSGKPTLVIVIGALFDCLAAALNRVWTLEVETGGAEYVLPAPLLTTLLENECCLGDISDLLITLQLPEVANTAWGYALASAAAETALKDLGFSRDDFAEVHGCTRLTKMRFVQRWKANGGAQTPQRKRPPPSRLKGVAEALAKQRKVQAETASGRPPRMNLAGSPSADCRSEAKGPTP